MTDPKNRLDADAEETGEPSSDATSTASAETAAEGASVPAGEASDTPAPDLIVTDVEPAAVVVTEVVPAANVETEVVAGEPVVTDVEPAAMVTTEVVPAVAVSVEPVPADPQPEAPTAVDPGAADPPRRTGAAGIGARQLPRREPVEASAPEPETTPETFVAPPTSDPAPETALAAEAVAEPAGIGAKRVQQRASGATARPKSVAPAAPADRPASPYAVIETGGKQYRVSVGETLAVERLSAEAGTDLTIDRVLLLGGNGGTKVGTPTVSGATVSARVDDHYRGEKIVVFKYKPKKRYRRRTGHRQSLTRLTITGING